MGKNSKIEWTEHTWNPWQGCPKVSDGCKHCYMYRDKQRFGQNPAEVVPSKQATFTAPLRWKDPGARVFVCSWSDFWLADADPWRGEAWDIIRRTPDLNYQIPTKRPENIESRLPADWGDGWANVWLGVSVENERYYPRLDILAEVPAALRFVSAEPLLGPLDLTPWLRSGNLDWVITGGESGPGARPADPAWFRAIREQCLAVGVPYFHKQNGGRRMDKGGKLLDGQTWNQFPAADVALSPGFYQLPLGAAAGEGVGDGLPADTDPRKQPSL